MTTEAVVLENFEFIAKSIIDLLAINGRSLFNGKLKEKAMLSKDQWVIDEDILSVVAKVEMSVLW